MVARTFVEEKTDIHSFAQQDYSIHTNTGRFVVQCTLYCPGGDLEEMAAPSPQISVGNTWGESSGCSLVFFLRSHGCQ